MPKKLRKQIHHPKGLVVLKGYFMTEKVNLQQQIEQYRQANPKCNNLSDKQILSIMIKNGQITLSEAQKSSIFTNYATNNNGKGLNVEKHSKTQTAKVPDVIVKSSNGKTYNFNKTLENRINNVSANLKKAEAHNGFLGKAWSGFKNLTGIGDSSDKVREQQEFEKNLLAQFNTNKQRRPQIFKQLTGVDYTPKNLEKFIKGEIILKSEQALAGYKEGQEIATDVIADVGAGLVSYGTAAVCVVGGIAAAPFTAGVSLTGVAVGIGIAAGTGAVVKTGIKYADAKSAGRDYTFKDAGHDAATGAFSGALAPVTAGAGGAIGKGVAVQTTKVLGKTALKEGTKQTVKNAVKFTAEVTADGAIGGGVDNSFRAAIDGGNAEEILDAGITGAKYGAILGPVMGWGGKAVGKSYKAAKQTITKADDTVPLPTSKEVQIESKNLIDINDDSVVLTKEKQVVKNGKLEHELELNEVGEKKARATADEIHANAVKTEKAILKLMEKAGLGTPDINMTHRPKSAQSLYDKIKNAVCDIKHPSSFKEAVKSIRDAVGTRTELADFNYKKHPDIVEMYKKDPQKAIQMAAERQSEEYVQKVKDIITNSVTDPNAQLKAIRISNYMGKDGIPYFSEKQVAMLQDHAAQHGIDLHVKNNLTKVRASGYTALQMNFQTKDGFTFEWQLRGSKVNKFAECEHVPYDIREDKDVTGGRKFLKALYEPIKKIVKSLKPEEFKKYNEYLTAHYEHLRKVELGFDSTPPKLEDFNLKDPKLKAENLELLHDISDKLKNGEIDEQTALLSYATKTENRISIPSGKFSAPIEKLEKGYILDAKTNKPVKVNMNKIKINITDYMNAGLLTIDDEFGNQLGRVAFDMRNTHAGLPGIHFEGLVSNVQGLGIGTKLIDELVKMSKAKGCEGRLLATASPMKGVNGKLTNLEFYYKKGFKAVSPEKHSMIEECIQQNKEIPLSLNLFTEIEYIPKN